VSSSEIEAWEEHEARVLMHAEEAGEQFEARPKLAGPSVRASDVSSELATIFREAGISAGATLDSLRGTDTALKGAASAAAAYGETRGGDLITDIDSTTQDRVQEIISNGVRDSLSDKEVADKLTPLFGGDRADLIARTEMATAWNLGVVNTLKDAGEEYVFVTDGDSDEECQNADGEIWTLEEAEANPLEHPNCIREFRPLTSDELAEVQAEEGTPDSEGFAARIAALERAAFYSEDQPRDDHGRWGDGTGGTTSAAKISEADAKERVHHLLVEKPTMSRAAALKIVRAEGNNISQERFKPIYESVKEERSRGIGPHSPPGTYPTGIKAPPVERPMSHPPEHPPETPPGVTVRSRADAQAARDAVARLNELPPEHRVGLGQVTIDDRIQGHSSWVGSYDFADKNIVIAAGAGRAGKAWFTASSTMAHEVGHHVHLSLLTHDAAERWNRIDAATPRGGSRISAYASANTTEHFAEAYRAWHDQSQGAFREKLAMVSPSVHAFMSDLHGATGHTMLLGKAIGGHNYTSYHQRHGTSHHW
jgi:hypothetical protein